MNTTTLQFKNKLTKAFKILRVCGYWCKQNHTCCSTCGWAEMPDNKSDKAVFYHVQDFDQLRHNQHQIYLAWSGDHELIIKVLDLCDIVATCDNPENEKIRCLTGNPIPVRVETAIEETKTAIEETA